MNFKKKRYFLPSIVIILFAIVYLFCCKYEPKIKIDGCYIFDDSPSFVLVDNYGGLIVGDTFYVCED